MPDAEQEQDSSVLRASADPPRRQILEDLRPGELTAGEIARRFPFSGPSVSRYVGALKGAGIIYKRREANKIHHALVEDRLALCLGQFMSVVCPDQLVVRHRRKRTDETDPV